MSYKRKNLKVFNALAPGMLPLRDGQRYRLELTPIGLDEARQLCARRKIRSYVGHEKLAEHLTAMLGVAIEYNRRSVSVRNGEDFLVVKLVRRRTNINGKRGEDDPRYVFLYGTVQFEECDLIPTVEEVIRK